MPSSKTHEMKIQLEATTGGSFTSTFSRAQQELSRMQQEIQRLNSAQEDISSYQKQQQAIEATTRKLERLKEQQRLLNKQKEEMRAAGQSTTALEREEKKLEQSVDNANTKLQQQQQKLSQTGDRLREAGVDMNHLSSESQRLGKEMNQLRGEQEQVAETANQMGQGMAQAFDAAASAMMAAGIVQGLREICDAFKECVQVAAEFEATMSSVEALSGANSEEMAALSAQAKELGATTVFSAQEAGDAMTYMGMAGWKAQDMISGMDGVLNLAAASGEDLAMVSDIVTDNLTAFGLKASDTGRFADVLAAAATNSNTSVSIMGETFKQSAAIAGALRYSIEDVAVATGLMANAGVKGSIAGTALKNTFNGLLEGATLTGEAFGEYEFSALKADGTMKDFASTMNELRGVLSQMTEAERVQNAMTLASKRGYNGLLAILNATEEDYNKLTVAINESSGAAERMAQIRLDNFKGDLALANSAAEAFKDSVGSALIPILRGLVQTATEGMTAINAFAEAHPEAIQAVAALTAGLGVAVAGIMAFSAAAKVIPLVLGVISANPIVLLAGAFAGLAVAGVAGADAVKANRDEAYQMTDANRALYQEIQQTNAAYQAAISAKGADSAEAIALRAHMDELTEAYEANKQTVSDWQAENQSVISSVQGLRDGFRETTDSISDQSTEAQALAYRLEQLASKGKLTDAEQKQVSALVDRLNTSIPKLGLNYDKTTGSLSKSTEAIKAAAKAQAKLRYEEEQQQYYMDLALEQVRLEEQEKEAKENLAAAQERLNALEEAKGPGSTMQDRQMYQDAAASVEMYQNELADLQGVLDGVNAELDGYDAKMAEAASAMDGVDGAIANVETALGSLSTAYSEAYTAARESFQGQFGLFEEAAAVTATSFDTIISNLNSQKEYWANYGENFNIVQQAAQEAEVDISGIMSRLADGSPEAAAGIAGLADEVRNSTDGGKQALSELAEAFSGAQSEMDATAQNVASASGNVQLALSDLQTMVENGAQNLDMPEQFRVAMENNLNAVTEAFSGGAGIPEAMSALQTQITEGLSGIDIGSELAQSVETAGGQATAMVTQVGGQLAVAAQTAMTQMQQVMTTGTQEAMQGATDAATTGGQNLSTATGTAATNSGTSFKGGMSPSVFSSAASSAMQAAINAIHNKQGALVAAARSAGQAAAAAFKAAQGAAGSVTGFASGTKSAPPGMALVGENGPELVYFHGGEEVFTAAETAKMLRVYNEQNVAGETIVSLASAGTNAANETGWTDAVVILPQLIEAMNSYKQATAQTEAEQVLATRMDNIIAAIRATPRESDSSSTTTVNINLTINGTATPDTVDQLRSFAASDEFKEYVVDAVSEAQRNKSRMRY